MSKLFSGKFAEEYEALKDSLAACAGDDIYGYIESIPKTSLVVELVDKLHQLGYSITPSHPEGNQTKE